MGFLKPVDRFCGQARPKNTVFLSSMGSHLSKHTGLAQSLYDAKQKFLNAKIPVTLLRASYFYENWIPALDAINEKSVLPTFLNLKSSIPMVSVKDVAAVAVDLLLNPVESPRVVELSGPRIIRLRTLLISWSKFWASDWTSCRFLKAVGRKFGVMWVFLMR